MIYQDHDCFFSAHGWTKSNVRYCHHFAFVIIGIDLLKPNICPHVSWVVLSILYDFRFAWQFNMAAWPIMLFDWVKFQKKSSQKQHV
jgi:hypothetical protein